MKLLRLCGIALFCVTGGLVPALTTQYAFADEDHVVARHLREAGKILSLETIADSAHAHKSGEILETELELHYGRYVYEVEILDVDGQVWELKLDAGTGTLISMERDD